MNLRFAKFVEVFRVIHPFCDIALINSRQKSSAFLSAEMFKKPLWQTVWTQIRLLLEQSVLGSRCLLLYLIRQ